VDALWRARQDVETRAARLVAVKVRELSLTPLQRMGLAKANAVVGPVLRGASDQTKTSINERR